MNEGMTVEHIREIQADAARATERQFRDAAEDQGWKPTEWNPDESLQEMIDESKQELEKKGKK